MASARDLLAVGGIKSPLRVWYWNLEDPSDELTRRIQATAMRYGLDQTDIEDRLFVDTGREQELLIAESTRAGALILRRRALAVGFERRHPVRERAIPLRQGRRRH